MGFSRIPHHQHLQDAFITWQQNHTKQRRLSFSKTMAQESPNSCLFCNYGNPSWKAVCGSCEAFTLPTRDTANCRLTWTFIAFGSSAPRGRRTSTAHFNDVFFGLNHLQRAAIFVGNGNQRVLLVQNPNELWKVSIQVKVGAEIEENNFVWTNNNGELKRRFHSTVHEILDDDDMVSGKHDPSKYFHFDYFRF